MRWWGVTFCASRSDYNSSVKLELEIPIPEGSLDDRAKERVRRDAHEAAVLRLFDERRISSAEAAQDLGMTRIEFMDLARRRGIPHYDYTAQNLAEDLADLGKVEEQLPPR
jgi:predicted HTH domain antitoxin